MSGTAPDSRSIFKTASPCADDAALLAVLGAAQPILMVGPDHFLSRAGDDTAMVTKTAGADREVSWAKVHWLMLHSVDISALSGLKINWIARPDTLSRWMAHLIVVGGLQTFKAAHEGELASWVASAAKIAPKFKLSRADVIELEPLSTGTWIDVALTADFISTDMSGRSLAQLREVANSFTNAADANKVKHILSNMIYSMERLTGDIQNIDKESQAVQIGAAFIQTELQDKMDYFVDIRKAGAEVFRRNAADPFTPLFDRRWRRLRDDPYGDILIDAVIDKARYGKRCDT